MGGYLGHLGMTIWKSGQIEDRFFRRRQPAATHLYSQTTQIFGAVCNFTLLEKKSCWFIYEYVDVIATYPFEQALTIVGGSAGVKSNQGPFSLASEINTALTL